MGSFFARYMFVGHLPQYTCDACHHSRLRFHACRDLHPFRSSMRYIRESLMNDFGAA